MMVRRYLLSSLAPSTLLTYRSGMRSYQLFCTQTRNFMFPLCESQLQRFAVSLANRISYRTIKVYLCGVQFCSTMIGRHEIIASYSRLYYVLRGIRRVQGDRFHRVRRLPITYHDLTVIATRVNLQLYTPYQSLMLRTASALAFFGLLRCSEYTSSRRTSYDPDSTLLTSDITFNTEFTIMYVAIKSSKTDPFRVGCTIRVAAVSGPLCPVSLMREYLQSHPSGTGPLFVWSTGRYLIRSDIVILLRRCFPNNIRLNTHSFRIGGASAAASAGVPDSQIQLLGRWSSDAYRRYIHVSDDSVRSLGRALVSGSPGTRVWDSLVGGSVPCLR